MGARREVLFTLAAATVALAARCTLIGISDPSEGRYAQIAWEMQERGDWVVPHWNGVPHLEKPPLAYWAGAAGIGLFGRTEWAIRFFPLLALLASALLAADIARRTHGDRAAAPAAAAVALLPYPIAVGGALLTDGFLLLSATLFFHSVLRRIRGAGPASLDLAAGALAAGILAKGHAILLFTLLPLLVVRPRLVLDLLHPRRLLLLALLLLPWFVAVSRRHPDFFALHAGKLSDFVSRGAQHHRAPAWIYVATLAAGMLPMSFFWPTGVRRTRGIERRLLLSWLLLPLLFLSAVKSRSHTYILPGVPALAILCAGGLAGGSLERHRGKISALLAAAAAGLAATAWVGLPGGRARGIAPVLPWLAGASALGAAVIFLLGRTRPRLAAIAGAAIASIALIASGLEAEPAFKIHRGFIREILATGRASDPAVPVVVADVELPSLVFYLGRPVIVAGLGGRLAEEAERWGGSDSYLPYTDIAELIRASDPGLVVTTERARRKFAPGRTPILSKDGLCLMDRSSNPLDLRH